MMGSFFDRFFKKDVESPVDVPVLPPGDIGHTVDLWIAQATSLRELRQYKLEKAKLAIAEAVARKRVQDQPESMEAWYALGRIYFEGQKPKEAAEAFFAIKDWAEKAGSAFWAREATQGLVRVSGLESRLEQNLRGRNINGMFYACQSCGILILYLGTHCPYCRFAPSTPDEAAAGLVLSIDHLRAPKLLQVARGIQQKEKPWEIIHGFGDAVRAMVDDPGVAAILSKLKESSADDFLDFRPLERCSSCGSITHSSWLLACDECGQALNNPDLVNLAICVHHITQHFVWGIHRSEAPEFAEFVTLLVNIQSMIIRHQRGPTDAERAWARQLLMRISPMWTQNMGGYVDATSLDAIRGTVVDESVNPQIGRTIRHLEGELRNFVRLTSDQVGLF
ncbi:tetratricopeptide repeat protein [Dyella solisilvae]|uniref:Tetratricopeptide repeat protein n=1 Tax=Dyella solisilvae TaxID=1920168 RepID=A0A370K8G8_9GAMM|nr:tetratricopeptide repeat protein [Dyella solisilvae]RDI98933.1 tetratricopeptide repeat protein [Dyella solisilvae]